MERPIKIISGGQTGVDQVGLEVGSLLGIETGGTAPKGFRTDMGDDLLLEMFGMIEDGSRDYRPRTIKNVQDSDLTIWFGNPGSPGGKLTIKTAQRLGKQILINPEIEEVKVASAGKVINIAGNRLKSNPKASMKARYILTEAFKWTRRITMPNQNCFRISYGGLSDTYYVPTKEEAMEEFMEDHEEHLPKNIRTKRNNRLSGLKVEDITE